MLIVQSASAVVRRGAAIRETGGRVTANVWRLPRAGARLRGATRCRRWKRSTYPSYAWPRAQFLCISTSICAQTRSARVARCGGRGEKEQMWTTGHNSYRPSGTYVDGQIRAMGGNACPLSEMQGHCGVGGGVRYLCSKHSAYCRLRAGRVSIAGHIGHVGPVLDCTPLRLRRARPRRRRPALSRAGLPTHRGKQPPSASNCLGACPQIARRERPPAPH